LVRFIHQNRERNCFEKENKTREATLLGGDTFGRRIEAQRWSWKEERMEVLQHPPL
jgi:hypothetical protein